MTHFGYVAKLKLEASVLMKDVPPNPGVWQRRGFRGIEVCHWRN